MAEIGYKLSSEEFGPTALVEYAARAEHAGFTFALISDHFHPWVDRQGQSPFVWGVLGGIAQATSTLRVGTAVTCPTMRVHPAIVAQAAATAAVQMPGRFFLGVGTGENLNEHVVGRGWPAADVRLEMLEEAIKVLRLLWEGGEKTHRGRHFTVENARIYTLPPEPQAIMVAASKRGAAALAGRVGDAMINTEPDRKLLDRFQSSGGGGKPTYVEHTVCWASNEAKARRMAREMWSLVCIPGPLFTELARPMQFEAALASVTEKQIAEAVVCGPDPARHVDALRKAARAGYTHICVHQIGPEQEAFIDFYETEVLPRFAGRSRKERAPARRVDSSARAATTRRTAGAGRR
jgi:G6PDH family F420-dependent oxidoreductase